MAVGFRPASWDPILLISQMVAMQSLYYSSLVILIVLLQFLNGAEQSLDLLYSYESLASSTWQGRLIIAAYVFNALFGAFYLLLVVCRTKQCLDFTATLHSVHLIICCVYNGTFPTTLPWWLLNTVCVAMMTVLGEFLCMRAEMKAIPLSLAPKVAL